MWHKSVCIYIPSSYWHVSLRKYEARPKYLLIRWVLPMWAAVRKTSFFEWVVSEFFFLKIDARASARGYYVITRRHTTTTCNYEYFSGLRLGVVVLVTLSQEKKSEFHTWVLLSKQGDRLMRFKPIFPVFGTIFFWGFQSLAKNAFLNELPSEYLVSSSSHITQRRR